MKVVISYLFNIHIESGTTSYFFLKKKRKTLKSLTDE